MKFTIHGFSQEKLIELGLDSIDALILRWFIDFKDTGDMATEIIENEQYYWIKYEKIVQDIPIAKLKTKDSVYRRLKKMDDVGILKHKTKKQGGTYSFYSLGSKYRELITAYTLSDINPSVSDEKTEGSDINPIGYGYKSVGGTDIYPEQKINLLNNIFNKEKEEQQEPCQKDEEFKKIVQAFNKYIHLINHAVSEVLRYYLDERRMNYEVIIRAMKEAALNDGRNIKYLERILQDWESKGLYSVDAVEAYLKNYQEKKKIKGERGQVTDGNSRSNSQESNPYANVKKLKLGGR